MAQRYRNNQGGADHYLTDRELQNLSNLLAKADYFIPDSLKPPELPMWREFFTTSPAAKDGVWTFMWKTKKERRQEEIDLEKRR